MYLILMDRDALRLESAESLGDSITRQVFLELGSARRKKK